MINVYPATTRYTADHGWLKSNFSFSFAEYFDPMNMNFGPMRVLNDDVVAPNRGFGAHPHKEMEIVSIVLDGYLKHEDSGGHDATTTFGGVQRMSAGTGVVHSEMNPSTTEPVNFLQMWFEPMKPGVTPSYEQTKFDVEKMKNALLPVVSNDRTSDEIADINQDMTIYLSDLEQGKDLTFAQGKNRRIFLFVIEGDLSLNKEVLLNKRDSARITDTTELHIASESGSRYLLIDLP
ncbi:pirin family protein [Pseudalkalibacillus berkeleyi]|uniref:Pirin family protein n=1 Tax=Pseudalkalibacillus berkeleyi TaxID=1069813 RepID=A0ABS9GUV5_9BACL|nr:pirin family protein [Pseudalkalibacillus berkeleyi]MCF6136617.1 pirin family protein [Pseudalkalibacillus berkeleyi]